MTKNFSNMEITSLRKLPAWYPNPYFHSKHRSPSVTFIRFAITPTGKRSRIFEQYRVYFNDDAITLLLRGPSKDTFTFEKYNRMTNTEIIAEASEKTQPNLKHGYVWGELFVQQDFSNRHFILPEPVSSNKKQAYAWWNDLTREQQIRFAIDYNDINQTDDGIIEIWKTETKSLKKRKF